MFTSHVSANAKVKRLFIAYKSGMPERLFLFNIDLKSMTISALSLVKEEVDLKILHFEGVIFTPGAGNRLNRMINFFL